ncbi:hypothetical protein [Enhygromyxa salina]|uniref:hypothetical protein n=1 Tax=Enhygromyxa salina TaxID=215803 RepID=UPI000D08DF22|nr:hypothetical protein [Enhygromyxa salina]
MADLLLVASATSDRSLRSLARWAALRGLLLLTDLILVASGSLASLLLSVDRLRGLLLLTDLILVASGSLASLLLSVGGG